MSLENVANDTYDLLGKIMNLDEATRRKIADYLLTHKDLIEQTEKYAKLNVVEVFRKQDNIVSVDQPISTIRKNRQ